MLYHFYELQHAAVAPARIFADHGQHLLRSPFNPFSYTLPGRALAAGLDLFEQTTRRYDKPGFGLDATVMEGREVAVEEEIVLRKTFGQLKHFRRATRRPRDPRLLIVAPMSGHYATLLRGTVEAMLPDHDVYITDWRDAREVPLHHGSFDLDDYVDYVIDFLRFLGPDTHVMAVCQPAVPVMGAVSLMAADKDPATPASMVLMGGPIDTRRSPTAVNRLAEENSLGWFEVNVVSRVPPPHMGAFRRVYPGFMQLAGFMQMNLGRHIDAHWQMFNHLVQGDEESAASKRAFYEEYRSVMDLTAEFYLQTIKVVFQDHALPKGEWVSRGRKVDPSSIANTAVMTVEGENDDISGLGQTRAAHDLLTGLPDAMKRHYEQKAVGHYGIFNGRKWRNQISPRVKAFIREHHKAG
ncbi:polyhydroxyalkanoate depolymerase [Inquilinus sp. CAU 1745]|uniref:polyhydroxyalkanoate depolymerase n=1 Tax=Inquilinus sp. CAU 1745 TaxID=3140369 RepID=UPI00325BDF64